jgi:filamentous hemagglutinin
MSSRAALYQDQITGRAGEAYVVEGVKFDGYDGTLLDAKGPGYSNFVNKNGEFYPWFRGQDSLLNQAVRQIDAADGTPVNWHVAEPSAVDAIRSMFMREGIDGISVIHTPAVQ